MSTHPPIPATYAATRTRARRITAPLLTAGLVAGTILALRLRDPHEQGSWGGCPFKLLTGWDCPGCGGLRAVNDLTHGDVLGAASSNLLFVLSIPFVIAGWALWTRRSWDGGPRRRAPLPGWLGTVALVALLALLVAFTVLRNTTPGAWLHS